MVLKVKIERSGGVLMWRMKVLRLMLWSIVRLWLMSLVLIVELFWRISVGCGCVVICWNGLCVNWRKLEIGG